MVLASSVKLTHCTTISSACQNTILKYSPSYEIIANTLIIMVHTCISHGENEVVLSSLAKNRRTSFDSLGAKGCSV